jgi:RHS repeat-associated protein
VPNRSSVQVGANPAVTTSYNAANRPTTDSAGGSYGHDVEGRMTARPGQTLEWDALGRLTAVRNSSSNALISSYTYDALDRLLTANRNGVDHLRFRYLGLTTQPAQIVNHANDTVIRSIANDWTGARLLDWTGSGANQRFYSTNSHHDVTWTGSDTGTVTNTLRYDPWGTLTASFGTSLPDFRFQGNWLDSQTNLAWIVTRWYAPALGRFISEDSLLGDPIDPPSRHLYAYGAGEPVARWDPDGRFWKRLSATDTTFSLASRYLGSLRWWPYIYNMNRHHFKVPSSRNAGACVWIPAGQLKQPSMRSDCFTGGQLTGFKLTQWRHAAARSLCIDWWMLTQEKLNRLTERETGFKNSGPRATYIKNLRVARELGKVAIVQGGGGTISSIGNSYWQVIGNKNWPPVTGAMTVGPIIFFSSKKHAQDPILVRHEYIHLLQYAANANFVDEYRKEMEAIGHASAGHRLEAIAYLWTAWLENYWEFGYPVRDPMNIWKAPTLDEIGWKTSW